MTSPNILISIRHVTKEYRYWLDRPTSIKLMLVDLLKGRWKFGQRRKFVALKDVSLEIGPGEFVGIMGRNGAGKSTLLKLIAGIYQPTSGTVRIAGQIAPLIELGAGFHPDLSGFENIFLNGAVLGFGRVAVNSAIQDILEFAEIGEKIHMPVKNYSTGMMARLGFAIAVHLAAPIILVDEVLSVGDAGFQAKCMRKIHELHAQGRTIILVTHSADAVAQNCQRCIVIDSMRKVYDGPVEEGVARYLQLVS